MRAAVEGALLWNVLRAHHSKAFRVTALQLLLAILAVFSALWLPLESRVQTDARIAEELRLSQFSASLPPRTYFFALNLYNSEEILEQLTEQLLLVSTVLGEHRVFISIWENGKRKSPSCE
jgi:hypothetical protein